MENLTYRSEIKKDCFENGKKKLIYRKKEKAMNSNVV